MKFRKPITFIILLCFILFLSLSTLLPRSAKANVNSSFDMVSLGDSIAYGFNAPAGQGYFDLFYSFIQKKPELAGVRAYNLSQPGDRSSDLLYKLEKNDYIQGLLKNARVVTVSIGGNNLLEPVIRSVATAYHLDASDPKLNTKIGKQLQIDEDHLNNLFGMAFSGTLKRS